MASSTVENYLKQIYLEQQDAPEQLVPMGKLAAAMGVVPGTATTMIKALADSGLVSYEPRGGRTPDPRRGAACPARTSPPSAGRAVSRQGAEARLVRSPRRGGGT